MRKEVILVRKPWSTPQVCEIGVQKTESLINKEGSASDGLTPLNPALTGDTKVCLTCS